MNIQVDNLEFIEPSNIISMTIIQIIPMICIQI